MTEATRVMRAAHLSDWCQMIVPVEDLVMPTSMLEADEYREALRSGLKPPSPPQSLFLVQRRPAFGEMHSYIRDRRAGLPERYARALFRQLVLAVQHVHANGAVCGDLKLRRLLFANAERCAFSCILLSLSPSADSARFTFQVFQYLLEL